MKRTLSTLDNDQHDERGREKRKNIVISKEQKPVSDDDNNQIDYLTYIMEYLSDMFIDVLINVGLLEYSIKLMFLSKKFMNFFEAHDWTPNIKTWYLSYLKPDDLCYKNMHPRDCHIFFLEPIHRYTIIFWHNHTRRFKVFMSNTTTYTSPFTSVTTYYKLQHFAEFDAKRIIGLMMASRNWPNSKYYGMSVDEIIKLWDEIRESASKLGTLAHKNIENFYNGQPYDPDTPEFLLFMIYITDYLPDCLYPYLAEPRIYDVDEHETGNSLNICGSVDMIYAFRDNPFDEFGRRRVCVVDWKRSSGIKMYNLYEKGITPLTKNDDNCNYVKYSYQGETYVILLEDLYNFKVECFDIVVIHPDQVLPHVYNVPLDSDKLDRIRSYRLNELRELKKNDTVHSRTIVKR
jgi:hypothetical protein